MRARWMRMLLALVVFLLSFGGEAHAAPRRRVILVQLGPPLERAITLVLSPWDLDLVRTGAGNPGPVVTTAKGRARSLAQSLLGDAVVWLTASEEESVIWVYDAETEQIASRVVGPPPFDDATAASIALSVKTLLRSTAAAPTSERFQAPPAPRPPSSDLRLEIGAGLRRIASGTLDARFGLGAAFAPVALGRRLAFVTGLALGLPAAVTGPAFEGTYSDYALSESVRAELRLGPSITFEPYLGVSLHLTTLRGVVVEPALPIETRRLDGTLDLGLGLAFDLGARLRLAVSLGASYLLRYQRFLVDDATAFERSPVTLEAGLRLGVAL